MVAELEIGVLATDEAALRARRLRTLRRAEQSRPLLIGPGVASRFAGARRNAATRRTRAAGVQDAWIAATALHHDAERWTQDDGFDGIPGLAAVHLCGCELA